MIQDPLFTQRRRTLTTPLAALATIIAVLLFVSWFANIKAISPTLLKLVGLLGDFIVIPACLVFFYGIMAWARDRAWHRHQQERHLVEEQGQLATEQPDRDTDALVLPATLAIGSGYGVYTWMSAIFCPILLSLPILGIVGLLTHTMSSSEASGTFGIFGFLLLGVAFIYRLIAKERYGVTVTEEGICSDTPSPGQKQCLTWEEIRFFTLRGKGTNWFPYYYVLSSDDNRHIRWMQLPPTSQKFLSMYRALSQFDEYERTAAALLKVVAGKTELPLYDLRKGQRK